MPTVVLPTAPVYAAAGIIFHELQRGRYLLPLAFDGELERAAVGFPVRVRAVGVQFHFGGEVFTAIVVHHLYPCRALVNYFRSYYYPRRAALRRRYVAVNLSQHVLSGHGQVLVVQVHPYVYLVLVVDNLHVEGARVLRRGEHRQYYRQQCQYGLFHDFWCFYVNIRRQQGTAFIVSRGLRRHNACLMQI